MSDPIPVAGQHSYVNISSPLTLIGIFVEVIREFFRETTVVNPEVLWHWTEDLKTTPLFIESAANIHMEARNTRPGVWVDQEQTVFARVVVGDQDQLPEYRPGALRCYYAMVETDIAIDCTAGDKGESIMLASMVHHFLHMSSRVIMEWFGLRDISPIIMGRTTPFDKDVKLMTTPLQFRVGYEARWMTRPTLPILQSIAARIGDATDPELYFREVSLRR